MNKNLLSAALVAVVAATAFAPSVQAATGTINFTGKVLADTCVINVAGNSSSTVALPTVMKSAFTGVGSTAGATAFNVALTGCDLNTATATMAFTAGANVDTTSGNLNNATTTGSDVQIQLLNSSSAIINTATSANAPVIAIDPTTGNGSTTLTAQYVATAANTKAGLVTSSVGFTLTYL